MFQTSFVYHDYSTLPYFRTQIMVKIQKHMKVFMVKTTNRTQIMVKILKHITVFMVKTTNRTMFMVKTSNRTQIMVKIHYNCGRMETITFE